MALRDRVTGPQARAEARLRGLITHAPDHPDALVRACAGTTDWAALFASAQRHGLAGVLHRTLEAGGATLPDAIARQQSELRVVERLYRARQTAVLVDVLTALDTAGVPAVALKGVVLAERLYAPEPSLRPTTDLDVMIREADFDRAIMALRPTGYALASDPTERLFRARHHHVHLARPGAPTLELHVHAYVGFGTRIDSEPWIGDALSWRMADGLAARVLAPEDEWIYLAVHAAGHVVRRLGWLYDLKLLSKQPIDWNIVFARADALGVRRVIDFMAAQVRRIRGTVPMRTRPSLRDSVLDAVRRRAADVPEQGLEAALANLAFSAGLAAGPAALARAIGARIAFATARAWQTERNP